MDSSPGSGRFDIFEIYRRFCDIRSGKGNITGQQDYKPGEESHKANYSKEALTQLLNQVETKFQARFSIFDELFKLMSRLDLMVDFSEFSRVYDFVFFMCREKGQKNITVSRAVTAWKLVLAGRFRLLNQWCDFIERNQRHNISEDTWQQVLAFSRCVHENLEGYDPEGAWPVLIDEFVEHMYSIFGSKTNSGVVCNCSEESHSWRYEESLPGLRNIPGLKRKATEEEEGEEDMELSETLNSSPYSKRIRPTNSPSCSSKSQCIVDHCLSKGFEELLTTTSSCLQIGRKHRSSSYT
ncbi:PREDICTED: uncharacterized protein LOC104805471 [Tarenaya hassleriana]|uniref:uncharacterized protein LOC104805471 n=1 Tax=Tarenaya hassleriana TaxID=28532 RepID=UPI00053C639F|nr:PREDICTED: uncharacterized protein LOC104805471 [Tarenaya hassleriana]